MKQKRLFLIPLLFLAGCASKDPQNIPVTKIIKNADEQKTVKKIEPYRLTITPIVGSRSHDAKVIMDTGVVLKIYIAPYKHTNTLIPGHDIYTYVKKPGFIVGSDLPKSTGRGTISPSQKLPFIFDSSNIDASDEITNEEIKEYINKQHALKAGKKEMIKAVSDKDKKNDLLILDYLNNKKGNR